MAKGITYIHECNPRRFVHGNIKPTNILLDNNYNPQISDFGLLRLQCIVEGSSLSGGVKRSDDWTNNNYRAPEARILVTRPSQKWDIYSFGVILLEMLTGRSAEFPGSSPSSVKSTSSTSMKSTSFSSSSSPPGELIRWVRNGFDVERPLMEMVDVVFINDACSKKEVVSMFRVALACTETDPDSRPKMKAVCDILDKIDVY